MSCSCTLGLVVRQVMAENDMSDHLKYFTEHVPATFVYAGISVERSGLFTGVCGKQIAGRCVLVSTGPFPCQQEWAGLVATLEAALRLHRHTLGSLTPLAKCLHRRRGGMIGGLSHLIRAAAQLAIIDGAEAITRPLLDTVHVYLSPGGPREAGSGSRTCAPTSSAGGSHACGSPSRSTVWPPSVANPHRLCPAPSSKSAPTANRRSRTSTDGLTRPTRGHQPLRKASGDTPRTVGMPHTCEQPAQSPVAVSCWWRCEGVTCHRHRLEDRRRHRRLGQPDLSATLEILQAGRAHPWSACEQRAGTKSSDVFEA